MSVTSTDHGSVLEPDSAALVVNASGEISFLMPDYPEDVDVPRMVLLLAAVLVKCSDREWVDEMVADLNGTPLS